MVSRLAGSIPLPCGMFILEGIAQKMALTFRKKGYTPKWNL